MSYRITSKHKMSDLERVEFIVSMSETDLLDEIKKFKLSTVIQNHPVLPYYDVRLEDMMKFWEIKDHEILKQHTFKVYLGIDNYSNIPLIQGLRLIIHAMDCAEIAAAKFASLKTQLTPDEILAGATKCPKPEFAMLSVYAKEHLFKSEQETYNVGWYEVFMWFENEKFKTDVQKAYSKIIGSKKT